MHPVLRLGNQFGPGVRTLITAWIYACCFLEKWILWKFLFKENQTITNKQKKLQFLLPELLFTHSILMQFVPETDSFSFSPGSCQYVSLVNGENQRNAQAQSHDSFLAFQGLCNGNHSCKLQFLPSGYVNIDETHHISKTPAWASPVTQCLLMKWRFLFITHRAWTPQYCFN